MSFNPALLNQNSVKKFVDRLEKIYAERFENTPVKRTQMYEDVAHLFGYDSWHNMDQAMKNAHAEQSSATQPASVKPQKVILANADGKSAVLHLLQNTQLPLTDALVQNQLMEILRVQSVDDMLQSCREISRFITHNYNNNADLLMKMGQKIRSECPDHFHEAREEIVKILGGAELLDFLERTNNQTLDVDNQTEKYLLDARAVMKRLDYIPQPFVSQRSTWTFEPLAAERLTSFEQIDEVLEKLKGELQNIPEKLKNAPHDVKSGVHTEVMEYVYGEHGVLFRAHKRYSEKAKYDKTSDEVDKALGITPNTRLKYRPRAF